MKLIATFALFFGLFISVADAKSWSVGEEREVDEGYYFTLKSAQDGWRVWQIETEKGTRCTAIKSVEGKPHPVPIGVASAFWRGTPFLAVSKGHKFGSLGRVGRFQLHGVYGGGPKTQFRELGARFWTDWGVSLDLTTLSDKKIEVAIWTYEYPASLVGGVHEKGVLNLKGLTKIVEMVEACGTLDY